MRLLLPIIALCVACGGAEPVVETRAPDAAPPAVVAPPPPKPKPKPKLAPQLQQALAAARNTPLRQRMLPAEWPEPRFVTPTAVERPRLAAVLKLCQEIPDHALDPAPYPCAELQTALDGLAEKAPERQRGLAQVEVLAHAVLLQFAWDVRARYAARHWADTNEFRKWVNALAKRREERTGSKSHLWRPTPEGWAKTEQEAEDQVLQATFEKLADTPVPLVLEWLTPGEEQYERLVKAHARYRALAAKGGFTKVPSPRRLRHGKKHKDTVKLRQRLREEGFGPEAEPADPKLFDDDLLDAVGRFQAAHQNKPYPKIGRRTARALRLTAEQKVGRIAWTLDRMRQITPREGFYVQVNVPDFHGEVWENGKRIHRFRTVVGSGRAKWDKGKKVRPNATQMISSEIDVLVFNPYWNVPSRIVDEEILPQPPKEDETGAVAMPPVGADGEPIPYLTEDERYTFLEEKGYEIMKRGTRWEYVRQPPGRSNPLGRVKFLFPNKHDIYLHDTPKQHVFRRARRDASHGCVRVHEPMALARLIMERDGADYGDVERWLKRDDPTQLVLKKRVPVYLDYLPVRVSDEGVVQFLSDVYAELPKSLKARRR